MLYRYLKFAVSEQSITQNIKRGAKMIFWKFASAKVDSNLNLTTTSS